VTELGEVDKAIEKTKAKAKSFGSEIGQSFSGALQGIAQGVAQGFGQGIFTAIVSGIRGIPEALADMVKGFLSATGALADLSAKTTLSTAALQEYAYAGSLVGVSSDSIASGVLRLSRSLGEGSAETRSALSALNLSFAELRSMNPEQQFEKVATALKGIEDPVEQVAIGTKLMGKGFTEILPLIRSDFASMREEAQQLGIVMGDDMVQAGDSLGDAATRLGAAWEASKLQMGGFLATATPLKSILEDLTTVIGAQNRSLAENKQAAGDAASGMVNLGKVLPIGELGTFLQSAQNTVKTLQLLAVLMDKEMPHPKTPTELGAPGSLDAAAAKLMAEGIKEFEKNVKDEARAHDEAAAAAKRHADALKALADRFSGATAQRQLDDLHKALGDFSNVNPAMMHALADELRKAAASGAELAEADKKFIEQDDQRQRAVDQYDALSKILEKAVQHGRTFNTVLSSHDFMGEGISGGSGAQTSQFNIDYFGRYMSDAPEVIALQGQLKTGAEQWGEAIGKAVSIFEKVKAVVMGVIAIFKEGQMANSAAGGMFGGAEHGAQVGSQFGAWGTVIGAVVGAVTGLIGYLHRPEWRRVMQDIGKSWGVAISEGLAKAIASDETKYGISRAMAELAHIGDIIGEAVAAGQDPTKFMGQIMQAIQAVANGSIPAAQGVEQLGKAFGELQKAAEAAGDMASQAMIDMIKAARAAGVEVPEIAAYVKEQIQSAIEGITKFIANVDLTFVPSTTLGGLASGSQGGLASLMFGGKAFMQQSANDAATLFAGTFWAAVAEMGLVAAATALGPAFAELKKKIKEAGLDMPESLSALNHIFKLINNNPEFRAAMEAIDGLSQALKGITNAGYLTQDMFDAFGRSAENAFNKAIKGGASEHDAMLAIAPYIQQIIDMHNQYGTAIPQWVTDLMAKHPEIKFKTDPLVEVVRLLTAIAEKLGAITDGADTATSALTNMGNVPLPNAPPGGPGGPPPPGGGGAGGGAGGALPPTPPGAPPPHATGYFNPALPYDYVFRAHAGERLEITPASQTPARNAAGGVSIGRISVAVYTQPGQSPAEFGEAVVNAVVSDIRRRGKIAEASQDLHG
jgi:hypothetical protein